MELEMKGIQYFNPLCIKATSDLAMRLKDMVFYYDPLKGTSEDLSHKYRNSELIFVDDILKLSYSASPRINRNRLPLSFRDIER